MTKVAFVQKCPSTINFEKTFQITGDVYNLSSEKVSKLLKRDIDLKVLSYAEHEAGHEGFYPGAYDWVILIGSEAVKEFSTTTNVSDHSGRIIQGKAPYDVEDKFIASISPAMLAFKPETRPAFEATVAAIKDIVAGNAKQDVLEGDYRSITDYDEAMGYLQYLFMNKHNIPVVGLDSETSNLQCRRGHMLGISMSHKLHQGVYIDSDLLDIEFCNLLQRVVEEFEIVYHNAKFDMHFFTYHLGIDFSKCKQLHDTMVQHYLLDERQGTHGLKSLTMKYGSLGDYDAALETFKEEYCHRNGMKKDDFTYDLIPWDIISKYAAKDTAATLELHYKFLPIIESNPRLRSCYYDLMIPGLMFLTKMENRGIPVSIERLKAARAYLDTALTELYAKLYSYNEVKQLEADQGSAFNPNSTPQLRKLLLDYLQLDHSGKLTATGALSTDAEVLEELSSQHPLPKIILDIRQQAKLINTYIDKLIPVVDRDGKVRTGFNLTTTTSGRLSSSGNFNVQQLPRDNPIIKGCVKAREGYKIVAVDLTTAEVYYAAVLSGDKNMQQIFINMRAEPDKYPDFHSNIAHMVFNLKCEPAQVKKQHPALRQGAKAITFGILYGSGPAKVAESVNLALIEQNLPPTCTMDDAKGYIETYFSKFKTLKRWIESCHNEIKTNGYIYNHFGRKRRLHNIKSADRGIAAGEVRSGFNAIIQSVSSDHLLLGALEADNEILSKKLDAEIFALVHDSVVAHVRIDQVDEYLEILIRNIQKDRGCSIPGTPIGVEQDSEAGGSEDYSSGKLLKMYPELAAL